MDRIYYETLTVPAGTAIGAAVSQAWVLEDNQLLEFTVQVPDGHCGLTGFRVMRAQQQVVPFANDSYIISNDRTFVFKWDDEITSTGLVLNGYNIDIFPHTFYCTATITNLPAPGELPPAEVVTPEASPDQSFVSADELTPDSLLGTDQTENIAIAANPPVSVPPEPAQISVPVTATSPVPKPKTLTRKIRVGKK